MKTKDAQGQMSQDRKALFPWELGSADIGALADPDAGSEGAKFDKELEMEGAVRHAK